MKKNTKSLFFYILIFVICIPFALYFFSSQNANNQESKSMSKFYEDMKNNNIVKVELAISQDTINASKATIYTKNNVKYVLDVPSTSSFDEELRKNMQEFHFEYVPMPLPKISFLSSFLGPMLMIATAFLVLMFLLQQMQGGAGGNRVMNFGKNRAKMIIDDKRKVTFENVAGLDEEKLELQEIVEFLKHPKKFIDIGARIPKGVLLVGPPGTGKTLLAKSVAGEAGVPFFSISGSDFVEMFVGVGASRVRDLFEQAKKNLPCIIFIDEIDAVGRRRGAGLGGGHDEREQTLNQLLVEMDGFGINEGVIIIAATNRPDILDPALLRPGRFDRQVVVGRPDVKGREEILKVHAKGKILASDIDFRTIALTTPGFTGADLENLLNEAALLTARDNKKAIDMDEVRKAFVKVGIGTEKKSRVISEKERKITAYHEAGHGIIHEILSELDRVHIISIIPTGMAGGYTMPIPGEDRTYLTKMRMEQEIIALLGGRAAEEIVLKDITTGASNDIERATAIARNMVTKYGMSKALGPILFGDDNQEVFIGRDFGHTRNYGEEVASLIDKEIRRIVEESYDSAKNIVSEYMDVLHKTAELLMEREKITGEEFCALFPEGSLTGKKSQIPDRNDDNLLSPKDKPTDDGSEIIL